MTDKLKSKVQNNGNREKILILEPNRPESHYWRDLYIYRELFIILAWRDIEVQYKQTIIGVAWAVLRPFLTMIILTVVFGRIAGLPSVVSAPYPVMVFAGMLPWFLFATSLNNAANSLVTNSNLVTKVYFPRLIVPVASSVVALVDFAISFIILLLLLIFYRVIPDPRLLLLPFFIFFGLLAALGPALIFASLNVRYRDFRFIIPFIVQLGLYISPVGFSSSIVPPQWRLIYCLNPMASVIDGFRWCLFGAEVQLYFPGLLLSLVMVVALMWLGLRTFRNTERTFADVI